MRHETHTGLNKNIKKTFYHFLRILLLHVYEEEDTLLKVFPPNRFVVHFRKIGLIRREKVAAFKRHLFHAHLSRLFIRIYIFLYVTNDFFASKNKFFCSNITLLWVQAANANIYLKYNIYGFYRFSLLNTKLNMVSLARRHRHDTTKTRSWACGDVLLRF